ncbi:MAG: hypothetical protein V1494_04220 [Candidatus Diapherotrites archaeon]
MPPNLPKHEFVRLQGKKIIVTSPTPHGTPSTAWAEYAGKEGIRIGRTVYGGKGGIIRVCDGTPTGQVNAMHRGADLKAAGVTAFYSFRKDLFMAMHSWNEMSINKRAEALAALQKKLLEIRENYPLFSRALERSNISLSGNAKLSDLKKLRGALQKIVKEE